MIDSQKTSTLKISTFELTDFESAVDTFKVALKKDASNGEAAFFLAES